MLWPCQIIRSQDLRDTPEHRLTCTAPHPPPDEHLHTERCILLQAVKKQNTLVRSCRDTQTLCPSQHMCVHTSMPGAVCESCHDVEASMVSLLVTLSTHACSIAHAVHLLLHDAYCLQIFYTCDSAQQPETCCVSCCTLTFS